MITEVDMSDLSKRHWFKLMLEVSDIERSDRFYRDDLGLAPVGRDLWPDDPTPNMTFQTADGAYVVLVRVPEVKPDGPAQHRNFMLPLGDYQRVYERIKQRGWLRPNYRTEMGVRSVGEVTCSLFDPDRHRLQLTAWRDAYEVPASKRGKLVAGRIEDFEVGSVTFNANGRFYLVRTADGLLALNQVCTHLQCNVVYEPEHYQYYCFCHNRRFNRTGRQLAVRVDVPPLQKYAIEIVDGQVLVDTDMSLPRTEEEADGIDASLAAAVPAVRGATRG
ncbi:MAG: Rieske 2Fe-2S domain-containing protein [Chloroflexi bacterium]|nr:Rieske 2Fe-2S domain-containing protein [Chloroflexota bacterium]